MFTLIQESGPGLVSNPNDAWSCVPLAGSVSELFYCKYCLGRLGRNCLVFTSLAACSYVNTQYTYYKGWSTNVFAWVPKQVSSASPFYSLFNTIFKPLILAKMLFDIKCIAKPVLFKGEYLITLAKHDSLRALL